MTNTPTQPDDLEAEVRELLPCDDGETDRCTTPIDSYPHTTTCPAYRRPGVLAALRKQRERADHERKMREANEQSVRDLERQLAEAKAEIEALVADVVQRGRSILAAEQSVAHLEAALAKIAAWDLPRIFDKELEREVAYYVMYGSNGEREFVRKLAREALAATGGKS